MTRPTSNYIDTFQQCSGKGLSLNYYNYTYVHVHTCIYIVHVFHTANSLGTHRLHTWWLCLYIHTMVYRGQVIRAGEMNTIRKGMWPTAIAKLADGRAVAMGTELVAVMVSSETLAVAMSLPSDRTMHTSGYWLEPQLFLVKVLLVSIVYTQQSVSGSLLASRQQLESRLASCSTSLQPEEQLLAVDPPHAFTFTMSLVSIASKHSIL